MIYKLTFLVIAWLEKVNRIHIITDSRIVLVEILWETEIFAFTNYIVMTHRISSIINTYQIFLIHKYNHSIVQYAITLFTEQRFNGGCVSNSQLRTQEIYFINFTVSVIDVLLLSTNRNRLVNNSFFSERCDIRSRHILHGLR